jgi:hypothetical protein
MRILILDLRELDEDVANLGDMAAHSEMENMLFDYAGKVIKVVVTEANSRTVTLGETPQGKGK